VNVPEASPVAQISDETRRELWGYGVWSFVALVIGVPELWAAISSTPPWPTISATVGHLEARWNWIALIVVAAIVIAAADAVSRLRASDKQVTEEEVSEGMGRTALGRSAPRSGTVQRVSPTGWLIYFGVSLAVVIAAVIGAITNRTEWFGAYILYGLIATLFIVIPNLLVYALKKEVPFPTLVQTIASLERRWHPSILLVVALVVILLLHLAFYPWPALPRPVDPTSA